MVCVESQKDLVVQKAKNTPQHALQHTATYYCYSVLSKKPKYPTAKRPKGPYSSMVCVLIQKATNWGANWGAQEVLFAKAEVQYEGIDIYSVSQLFAKKTLFVHGVCLDSESHELRRKLRRSGGFVC